MSDRDCFRRFLFESLGVRGEIVRLDASWQAIRERNAYPDAVATQLGQALAAVTLLSGTIKFRGSLILQMQGDGPLHTLVAQATRRPTIRGLARWQGEVPTGVVSEVFGHGRLALTAEAPSGERYQGIVALAGLGVAEALEAYFRQSEQLATRFWLMADNGTAADADGWRRVGSLADTLNPIELRDTAVTELLRRLFHEETVRLFEAEPVAFRCGCSSAGVAAALRLLGTAELEELLREDGEISVDCEFCSRRYRFDSVDIEQLSSGADQGHVSTTRH